MDIIFSQNAQFLESDMETPIGFFMRLVGENQGIFLESAEVDGRWGCYSIIATDFLLTVSCQNGKLNMQFLDENLSPLRKHQDKPFLEGLQDLFNCIDIKADTETSYPPITRAFYGYLGYDFAGLFNPKLAQSIPPEDAQAQLVLPRTLILFDHVYNKIIRLDLTFKGEPLTLLPSAVSEQKTDKPFRKNALSSKQTYMQGVTKVKELIRQGEVIQVVLSASFEAPLSQKPFEIYRKLRRLNPSPYMFYMQFEDFTLMGSSPEVLISSHENTLKLCPIAGTRPRSKDHAEDIFFEEDLLDDEKEKAEHTMLVDLGRNDLGCIATPGSVHVERYMEVERFSHVMHLTSRIRATLSPGLGIVDVLKAAFPAGTVSGAPKIRAMEIIAEMEQAPRGPYAGAIGWLGLDKTSVNLDLGITIRSLWFQNGTVQWQAGAGIVYDSDPEKEWQECLNKSAIIRDILQTENNGSSC